MEGKAVVDIAGSFIVIDKVVFRKSGDTESLIKQKCLPLYKMVH